MTELVVALKLRPERRRLELREYPRNVRTVVAHSLALHFSIASVAWRR